MRKWVANLRLYLQTALALFEVEGCLALIEYLVCHRHLVDILKVDKGREVLRKLLMILIRYTIEPWCLRRLPDRICAPLPQEAASSLKQVFSSAKCYASDINYEENDASWPSWLDTIRAKLELSLDGEFL